MNFRFAMFCWALCGLVCGAGSLSAQSSRPGMGSIPYSGGVTFRTWAPNASSVAVRGDFNGWGNTYLVSEGNGNWSVDVSGAVAGQQYKYRINNSFDRRDPRARRVTASNGNSIIYDPDAFDWGTVSIPKPLLNDVVIYQMHVGTFEGGWTPRTFDDAINHLDHVQNLGISAIKVMPITEFPGSQSWGYNPAEAFAIESDYGGPDAFKRFVKACHERGMIVIIDIVHNHHGPTDLDTWRFDGWYQGSFGGIYYYNDSRAYTPWGTTRPDFGRPEVRQFIRDQVFMFVDEYRAGGFRWDSVYNILNTDQGANDQGRDMLGDINLELLANRPWVIRGSEDNAFDFSINFQTQWDVGYRWDLHGQVTPSADSSRNMNTVAGLLSNWAGLHRVVFTEAHDYIASNHGRSRLPSEIDSGDPTSIWARKRSLLAAGIVMTTPGVPMIFQGQEMLETQAFHDNIPLRWNLTNTYAGIVQAYTDLIQSRRNRRDGMQGLKGTGIDVHHIDDANKVVSYIRWDSGGMVDDVLVAANFSSSVWTSGNYFIEFPSTGTWYSHFNSDSAGYQPDFGNVGATQVVATGNPPMAAVDMGSYSLQIFSLIPPGDAPQNNPGSGAASFEPEEPTGCIDFTVFYDSTNGPLEAATNVVLYVGHNGWLEPNSYTMTNEGTGVWSMTIGIVTGAVVMDMAFNNGAGLWDNNGQQDWHLPVTGCEGPSAPQLTTDPVTSIGPTTAVSGGNVTNDGGASVTERGIVWSSSPGPTTLDNKSIQGAGTGTFTNTLTSLIPGRTYYVRAYAISGGGTGYGNEESFTAACFDSDPVVQPATMITESNFVANWTGLAGATAYQVDVATNADFTGGSGGGSAYTVDFEGPNETRTDYSPGGTVNLSGLDWYFNQARIGTSSNDRKNGNRAGRIRRNGSDLGEMTMLEDVTSGLGTLRFLYARYGTDSSQPNLYIEYSQDQGTNWTLIDTLSQPYPNTLTEFSNDVNVAGNVRVRFRTDDVGSNRRRINIEDIVLEPFGGDIDTYLVTNTSVQVGELITSNSYYYRVKAIGAGSCASSYSATQAVTTATPIPPGIVTVDPASPQGCVPVTFTYEAGGGALDGATNLVLEIGHNGWLNVLSLQMTNTASNTWTVSHSIPAGTWQLDFVFHDGLPDLERTWDNNNGAEWQVYVTGCFGAEYSFIAVTNPSSDTIVGYGVDTFTLEGSTLNVVGDMAWENYRTGETGVLSAADSWQISDLDLEVGANLVHISGYSGTDNPNDGARDSATNELYTSGGWTSGQDGGTNWGGGWVLSGGANAGHFVASATESNLSILPNAWGLWAYNNGLAEAERPFADQLHTGDVVTLKFDNNWIDNGGSVGVGFQNGFNENLLEFYFAGGDANYTINAGEGIVDTGIPWTGDGLDLSFELTSPTTYRFLIDAQEFTGTVSTTSETLVRKLRFWNYNAGGGWERNFYVSDIQVAGIAIEGEQVSAERTINRKYGPYYIPTPLPNYPVGYRIQFPVTEIGYIYDIDFTTNLPGGVWTSMGHNVQGNGVPLTMILTNSLRIQHFRTSVRPSN